jgi:hypothetical protein
MRAIQQLVRIAALGNGTFVPAKRESVAAFRTRILAQEELQDVDSGGSTILGLMAAMERGTVLAPVFAIENGGELHVVDGWLRCCAAALVGRGSVRAVVFHAASLADCDALSTLLFDLEGAGMSWWERAAAGQARQAA